MMCLSPSMSFLRYLVLLFVCLFPEIIEAQNLPDQSSQASVRKSADYGVNDTLMIPALIIDGEWVGGRYLSEIFIWGGKPKDQAKFMEKWNRLRNAVYVTYPYAKSAGLVMVDVNRHLQKIDIKSERRKYIRSREEELRKAFGEKITDLSIFQGKVLMKLINRQTGDNCYEIIKEMKGGATARLYQTIMFFVGSSLKQNWNPHEDKTDRLIEGFVQEIEQVYAPSATFRNSGLAR